MKYIYQIGRLDNNILEKKQFKIEDKTYSYPLSGIALKDFLGKEAKLVILYPVSLALNRSIKSNDEKLKDIVIKTNEICTQEESFNNFIQNPRKFFEIHPHKDFSDDFSIIHSVGKFENKEFFATFDFIVLEIFCDVVKRYIDWQKNRSGLDNSYELFLDISTGQNIYVSAMVEAMRHFIVFHKLQNWTKEENLVVKIVFSDPIIGTSATEYKIYFDYNLDVKVFLSSPIRKEDLDSGLTKSVAGEDKELKQRLISVLKNFAVLFSSFKNTTPLVWYNFEFDKVESLDDLIGKLLEICLKNFSNNWLVAEGISKENFIKVVYVLSFYKGLLKIFDKESVCHRGENGVSLDELDKTKEVLKKYFGGSINVQLLGKEISNLRTGKDKDGKNLENKADEEWKILSSFLYGEGGSFDKRNFVAHSGFERNIVQVRKCDNKLFFRYNLSRDVVEDIVKNNIIESLINYM